MKNIFALSVLAISVVALMSGCSRNELPQTPLLNDSTTDQPIADEEAAVVETLIPDEDEGEIELGELIEE